jgi:hypothetical protein
VKKKNTDKAMPWLYVFFSSNLLSLGTFPIAELVKAVWTYTV